LGQLITTSVESRLAVLDDEAKKSVNHMTTDISCIHCGETLLQNQYPVRSAASLVDFLRYLHLCIRLL
jgi:hypothetical protein